MSNDPHFLHAVAKSLERPDIPASLTMPCGRRYQLSVVRNEGQDELVSQLLPRRADENWGVAEWISYAMLYPGFVVSIRRDGDNQPSGFLAFDTRVFIFHGGQHEGLKISITVEPQVVYVSPDARAQGLGNAFVALLSGQLKQTLALVEDAVRTSLKASPVSNVAVTLEAECVSEGGARFVRNAFAACQTVLDQFSSYRQADTRWCSAIEDAIDYSDWADDELVVSVPGL